MFIILDTEVFPKNMRVLIWLMIASSRCHFEHNIETNPFQLLRKFFNVDNEYNEFKRSYPWNPMKAVSYRDWIRQLLESPVYQK